MDMTKDNFCVKIHSFGFKNGVFDNANFIFDVRFLPNPYYIPELKEHNGTENEVFDYVMSFDCSKHFFEKLCDMFSIIIPHYIENNKPEIIIGIGCTGGKHRSVTIAEALYKELNGKGINATVAHRDINKE